MPDRRRVLWILSSIMDAYNAHVKITSSESYDVSVLWSVESYDSESYDVSVSWSGESYDSESYDVSVLWSVVSLMSLMICASYVGTEKSSMNDDKKDHDMDSANSADIALQDFLKDWFAERKPDC